MTETFLKRTQFGLQADSEDAYKLLGNIPVGTMVVADIRDQRRRSTDQHRFWFSMVNTLYESQEYYKKFDTFRHSLLVVMGYCDVHKLKGGRIYLTAQPGVRQHGTIDVYQSCKRYAGFCRKSWL